MENKKNFIFFIIVFTLIFNCIPELLQLNFLAGIWALKLTTYPFLFAIGFTLFHRRDFSLSPVERKTLIKFFTAYFAVMLFSLVWGLIDYPYYNVILQGPANQIEKFSKVYSFLLNHGFSVTKQGLLSAWMLARPIKGLFINTLGAFGLSILVYVWYKNDFQNGFCIFLKGLFASVIVVVLYGFFDAMYLSGNEVATNILVSLNPIVHEIKVDGTWWPPILWIGQLRSCFAEPSFYGIFGAFALPWVWYILETSQNRRNRLFTWGTMFFFILFLFLTRARTSNVLLLGEVALLLLFTIAGLLKSKRTLLSVILCVALAFGTSLAFFNYGINQESQKVTAFSYMEDNIGSLASVDRRSNRSRYSIMIADLRIGLDHPLFGVGSSLRNAYIPDYLPDKEHLSGETKDWIKNQKEKGILRAGFPELGEYTSRFAETGILGLVLFMIPPLFLLFKMTQVLRIHTRDMIEEHKIVVFFIISFLGVLASGIGGVLNFFYSYWLLLGLGFVLLHHVTTRENSDK